MKLFLLICLIWMSNVFSMPGKIENSIVNGKFYPTLGSLLVTLNRPTSEKVFGVLSKDGIGRTRVRKVKTAELNLGLSKGDIVYRINLLKKTISKYEIKDYVNILLYSGMLKTKNYWNEYYLILSDDPSEIEQATKDIDYIVQKDGFAYIGKDLDFSKAYFDKRTITLFTGKKLPPPSSFWEKTKQEEVRFISLLNNDLYFNNEVSALIPKAGGGSIDGWIDPDLYSIKQNYIELIVLNKNQYLIPLFNGSKWQLGFLFLEPGNPQLLKTEYDNWK